MIDPGPNVVSFVKFAIVYDASKLSVAGSNSLVINTTAFKQVMEGPVASTGQIAAAVGVGSQPTDAITTPTKIGTLTFSATQNSGAPVEIKYGPMSQVLSIGPNDRATDNVLATTESAFVVVGQQTATIVPSATGGNPTPTGSNPTPTISINPTGNPTPTIAQCSPAETNFYAVLSGDRVVPPNTSPAIAVASLTKQATPNFYTLRIQWQGMQANSISAVRIHNPALPNQTAPTTATVYTNPTGNQFPSPLEKTDAFIPQEIFPDVIRGRAYMTIDTAQYPEGEIRGQMLCGPVPPLMTPTPGPVTPTPGGPTPTMRASGYRLILQLLLHGIGAAGDSANKANSSLSNKTPAHQEVPLNVQVVNSDNQVVSTKIVTAFYDADNGIYFSHVDIPTSLPKDEYVIKIKGDKYLRKLMPGFFTITPGQATTLPKTDLVTGDVNGDNQINVLDYNVLYDCGYGALRTLPMVDLHSQFHSDVCQSHTDRNNADLNDDGKISSSDYNLFVRELSVQSGE